MRGDIDTNSRMLEMLRILNRMRGRFVKQAQWPFRTNKENSTIGGLMNGMDFAPL